MSVTGLTGAAAACCDEEDEGVDGKGKKVGETLPRGRALGGFRSMVSGKKDISQVCICPALCRI